MILSIIGTVAAVVGGLKGYPLLLQIGFFVVAAVALFAAFVIPFLWSHWQIWKNKRNDDAEIAAAMPKLRVLANDFSKFVSSSSGETLHYIASDILCKGDHIAQAKLGLPPMEIWTGLIRNFHTRLERAPKDAADFAALVMEFHFMVGTYDTNCVYRVFESYPKELRAEATEDAKRHLGKFYQQFTTFLSAYQDFGKETAPKRPAFANLPLYLQFPKPF